MAHFTLRLPDDLQADMERLAEEHDRSLHSEVIQAVKAWIDHYRTCSECSDPADVFCQICQPPAWFCRYHYAQHHLPEEERDEMVTQYYDVWQKEQGSTVIPVEIDVKAESEQEACEIISQESGIPVEQLQASEASNPGYREV